MGELGLQDAGLISLSRQLDWVKKHLGIHKVHFWVRGSLERVNLGGETCAEGGARGS